MESVPNLEPLPRRDVDPSSEDVRLFTSGIVVDEGDFRALRIAVVTETYPPEINGVSITIARFIDGLRARGHEVQVIRPRQQKAECSSEQEVLLRGLPIPRYPHLKMGLPAKNALLRRWGSRRPDVVHIVTEGPLGWSALQAATKLRLPVTSDFRTNFHAYSAHYGIAWLKRPIFAYLRRFHNRTLCTMVPTAELAAELTQMGFKHLRVVSRGVDTQLFHPQRRDEHLRRRWGADAQAPVALYVGRIASEKNLATLVQAYDAMRLVRPDLILVIVGDGPQRDELEKRLPSAIFAGIQRDVELARHYASADLFLFPSITETFGNVTLEAMASGLAVVAYDYAAAAQVINDEHNGKLARYSDADSFVASGVSVMREWPCARALGAEARRTAETLGWDQLVRDLEGVLHLVADTTLPVASQFVVPAAELSPTKRLPLTDETTSPPPTQTPTTTPTRPRPALAILAGGAQSTAAMIEPPVGHS